MEMEAVGSSFESYGFSGGDHHGIDSGTSGATRGCGALVVGLMLSQTVADHLGELHVMVGDFL